MNKQIRGNTPEQYRDRIGITLCAPRAGSGAVEVGIHRGLSRVYLLGQTDAKALVGAELASQLLWEPRGLV